MSIPLHPWPTKPPHYAMRAFHFVHGLSLFARNRMTMLVVPVALVLCVAVLASRITPETLQTTAQTLAGFGPLQWMAAILFSLASYLAIGRNEAAIHDMLHTGICAKRARQNGMQAMAISQAVGIAMISGAFARKRGLHGVGLVTAGKLSVAASLSFLLVWGGLSFLAVLHLRTGSALLVFSALSAIWLIIRAIGPISFLPGWRGACAARVFLWSTVDMLFAALVLLMFLPPDHGLSIAVFSTAYLIALGSGLMSQSPGGIGAMELALMLMLPVIEPGALLAAVIAYRVVYHALPALIATITLIPTPKPTPPQRLLSAGPKAAARARHRSTQADWGLVHQGATIHLTRDQSAGWLTRTTAMALVAIGRPLGTPALTALTEDAIATGRSALLYKCDNRTAFAAHKQGWSVNRLAQEATIIPGTWSPGGSQRRQLRRKLKSATKAGLRIQRHRMPLPLTEMQRVAHTWETMRGAERGFSMGRFCPDLLEKQHITLAYVQDELVGFVSFHTSHKEWGLDLIRYSDAAPCGTMHALITSTISQAREENIDLISLAACPAPQNRWLKRVIPRSNRQFKQSFAPKWRPLYAAAPNRRALIIGLCATAKAIRWPGPLNGPLIDRPQKPGHSATTDYKYTFDFILSSCDAVQNHRQAPISAAWPDTLSERNHPHDQRPDPPA